MPVRLRLIAFSLFLAVLTGCAPQPAVQAPALAPSPTENAIAPTLLPTATQTARPTPTATTEPAATATPAPHATSELNTARLLATGFLPRWEFFFTIEADQPLTKAYYGIVAGDKRYECVIVTLNPERLYCWGPLAAVDRWVRYAIYEQETGEKVNEGRFFIPIELDG